MKNLIIASTSSIHGSEYLEYILEDVKLLFSEVKEVLFIPYARPSGITYSQYTNVVRTAFDRMGLRVKGIHEFEDQLEALKKAEGIFVGGGNTFLLVSALYDQNLLKVLQAQIEKGVPYLGTSAGSNICGPTMQNTNDMPIVMPPSFTTMGIIPFNVNAHFLDPDPSSKHKGETRETRIKEFHFFNEISVLGLREGSWLEVKGEKIKLKGSLTARLFVKNKEPTELKPCAYIDL